MRTANVCVSSPRSMRTCPAASPVCRACSSRSASSGATSCNICPRSTRCGSASSAAAEALATRITPSGVIDMTPADTPASTASVKRRRVSSSSLAPSSAVCCAFSWLVIRLKARSNTPISSAWPRTGTRTSRSPSPTRSAALARRAIGATRRLASHRANQMATISVSSDTAIRIRLKRNCITRLRSVSALYSPSAPAAWLARASTAGSTLRLT